MTWETGLGSAVRDASLVINPSLWSAPIEGALVKSIVYARRTAVVDTASSWSAELPPGLVLRLPASPVLAAELIGEYLRDPEPTCQQTKRDWYREFKRRNDHLLSRILRAVQG
jgi:hypothetical protein